MSSNGSPFISRPDSNLPTTTVPMSLYFSETGIMTGPLILRSTIGIISKRSSKEEPLSMQFSASEENLEQSETHSHHEHTDLATLSFRLAPVYAETGINVTSV